MPPSEKLCPRGRTDRTYIETIKTHTIPLQRIDMGRMKIDIPAASEISPTLIISKKNQNIR